MLTPEEIKHIATLARIDFTDAEFEYLQREFDKILNFIAKLNEIETKGITPTAQVGGFTNSWRSDAEGYSADAVDRNALLDQAPKRENDHVKVKAVFE
ncbi:MAG: Asp-tRNA(Asn)/Glu-tRNA(Gln) amidotransferase subunit GatC [bacterium]|nr:Asp-tRNA(Asn)/Glu-tRNA(Gln) amidotransferase subunit GatC [bacterium]